MTVKTCPATAKRGALPNEHGVYTCPPDLVTRWREGRNYIEAALLELDGGIWIHKVDYMLKDGGAGGPFWFSPKAGGLSEALAGVTRVIGDAAQIAEVRGIRGKALERLRVWADGLPDIANWQVPEEDDDLLPEGLIAPRDFSVETAGEVVEDGDTLPQKSPRGRKPVPPRDLPVPAEHPAIDGEIIRKADAASAMLEAADREARAVAARVGYQLPADSTDPDLICRDIAANMRRSVESVMDIGRGLLVLKRRCPHGDFQRRVDALGLAYRAAAKFMSASLKFSNVPTSAHLLPKIESSSKLFELLVLDDEEIAELAEVGVTGELALDEVACMTVRELRAKLREMKARASAKDAALSEKEATIQSLQEDLASRKPTDAAAVADVAAAEEALSLAVLDLQARLLSARKAMGEGPRSLSLTHAALEKGFGLLRQAGEELGCPLAVSGLNLPKTPAEAGREIWALVDAELGGLADGDFLDSPLDGSFHDDDFLEHDDDSEHGSKESPSAGHE